MSDPIADICAAAEAAGVPWSYDLSQRAQTDPEYRARLSERYVARKAGLPDPGPGSYSPRLMEADLHALGDFTCRPLQDFALRTGSQTHGPGHHAHVHDGG